MKADHTSGLSNDLPIELEQNKLKNCQFTERSKTSHRIKPEAPLQIYVFNIKNLARPCVSVDKRG